MKAIKMDLEKLHNEEHFQFNTEFKDLVTEYGAATIDIGTLFESYKIIYAQEEDAIQIIRKSALTEELTKADSERDIIVIGFVDAVKSALKHYNETNRAVAARIKVVLDKYGDIARESYDKETADLNNLVQLMQGAYASDVTTLGLSDWVVQLDAKNHGFDTIMKSRYTEEASKTEYRMKQARKDIDTAYRNIIERLDALMLINGTDKYLAFVNELNSRIDKYNLIIAQRHGRNAKSTTTKSTSTDTTK